MIELFLSTDGKHTVHVSADTPEQMKELVPTAKALYHEVLAEYGTKAQPRETTLNVNGQARSNGHAQAGKRIVTSAEAEVDAVPHCPMHKRPMAFRQGRLGPFWSCPTRKPDGRWCQVTKEVTAAGNGQVKAA